MLPSSGIIESSIVGFSDSRGLGAECWRCHDRGLRGRRFVRRRNCRSISGSEGALVRANWIGDTSWKLEKEEVSMKVRIDLKAERARRVSVLRSFMQDSRMHIGHRGGRIRQDWIG